MESILLRKGRVVFKIYDTYFNLKYSGFALFLRYFGMWLVQNIRALLYANQTPGENQSWLGRPRFPALLAVSPLLFLVLMG